MHATKKIAIGVLFLLVILGVVYFLTREPSPEITPVQVSAERLAELQEMKDKDFYEDSLLDNLGRTAQEVVDVYGAPTEVSDHYLGGEELYYEDLSARFVLAGEEGVVNNLYLTEGAEIWDVEIGMTFDEIEEVLGEPEFRELDAAYGEYILVYFMGEKTETLGELEVWFFAPSQEASTEHASVLWKKYWD